MDVFGDRKQMPELVPDTPEGAQGLAGHAGLKQDLRGHRICLVTALEG